MRILIAEDDSALASFVKKGLDAEHYAVDVSNDGEQARAMAGEFDYDLVVLDLNLPRLDGVAILRYLRTRKPSMPILVLTGRTRVEDRVQCLDLGADDYLGKPFSFSELSARIRALLRRSHLPAESVLTVEDLKLDRVERRVERAGRRIDLTGKEFALLEYLMRNAGRRITRAMIIEHVWNLSFDTCTNVVDVYVNYLRRKVDDGFSTADPHHPRSGIRTAQSFRGTSLKTAYLKPEATLLGNSGESLGIDCGYKRLVSDIFHDLSQPLSTLTCLLEINLLLSRTPKQWRHDLKIALTQAHSIVRHFRALRELWEAGNAQADQQISSLTVCLREVVADLLPGAGSADVRLSLTCSSAISSSGCTVNFHGSGLRQGLTHLLEFAIESCRPGAEREDYSR